ncbi:PLD nuclease N-terminal domain-containing protein [Pseudomonas aeruginosa]|uniref:PLD nuclease N-terminal domain-containing protein n=6 Tax=Gammaproteobacteria TaxID=1236 RepID=UPI000FF8321A|nr:PLD nuclease N-terminal domain-containing protein [Pseudomonas aeruginosa]RPO46096.1 hypothetical protein IPC1225_21920 [Pseudomonas aeruginosa]
MSQSLAFLLIGLATLVGFYDLWAFVSVFRSDRSVNSKALWSLLIAVLPVLGVLIWASRKTSSIRRSGKAAARKS